MEKLPFLLCTETKGSGGLEVSVGKNLKDLETAGEIHIMFGMKLVYYIPRTAKKINSFHIRKNDKFTMIMPGQIVKLDRDEAVGWGYEEPIVSLSEKNIRIRYW